jgi:DNA-binding response OmpR family regulator
MALKAMIVEDEKDLCLLLSLYLNKHDFQTSCAHNIEDAKKNIVVFEPALVLLDNNLPDGLGTDFIPEIKSHNPDTKVIMITAFDHPEVSADAFKNGADFFLRKPFNITSFQTLLNEIKK